QSTISCSYGEFKRGRENVDAVRKLIIEDRHVTYHEIDAKLVSRWIPHLLTPTKVIRSRSVSKKMVATFVSKAARTVTADWYTTICLPKVISELRKINSERRIILHQDHASSHAAQKTMQHLTEENVELLDHPPYSPDLSLRGQRFRSPEKAVDAFKNAVLDLPANEWNNCFEINISKNNKVIQN
ncbi:unnamed protein product, partial [Acanthoscelides obtectus]